MFWLEFQQPVKKGHVYYRCHTPNCPTKCIREEIVSEFVSESFSLIEFSPEETAYLRAATERLKRDWIEEREKVSAALSMSLTQTKERLARLTNVYLDQDIEKELFEERKTALLMERRAVEEQIADLSADPEGVPEQLRKFLELAGAMKSVYSRANPEQKRSLLKIATSNLRANEKTLIFPYASPFQAIASRHDDSDGTPSRGLARTCEALLGALMKESGAILASLSGPQEIPYSEVPD
ncbi:MAG TPA: hypothetical protein VKX49_06535 [Bryobacteraceae bacterium]|jgi:hypothetical protein|nr:hypothetical protein [Bryobacteraceae bacterium]